MCVLLCTNSENTECIRRYSRSTGGEEEAGGAGAFVVKQIVLADRLVLVECLPDDALAFSVRAADQPRSQLTLQVFLVMYMPPPPLLACSKVTTNTLL